MTTLKSETDHLFWLTNVRWPQNSVLRNPGDFVVAGIVDGKFARVLNHQATRVGKAGVAKIVLRATQGWSAE